MFSQPAGVGFGQKPPVYLKPGDEVAVTVSGLGVLKNQIAAPTAPNRTLERHQPAVSAFSRTNFTKSPSLKGLTTINSKPLYYRANGKPDGPPIVFIHGLGATNEYFTPLISALKLEEKYHLHLYDFEGHGLSPTHPLSKISIGSLAADLNAIFSYANIPSGATLISDGFGCLIAQEFVHAYPGKISREISLSPPPDLQSESLSKRLYERAKIVRKEGMAAIVDSAASSTAAVSLSVPSPLALAARRISLLGQDPEGYAKACEAFGWAFGDEYAVGKGAADEKSTDKAETRDLEKSWLSHEFTGGHWSVFQNLYGLTKALGEYL